MNQFLQSKLLIYLNFLRFFNAIICRILRIKQQTNNKTNSDFFCARFCGSYSGISHCIFFLLVRVKMRLKRHFDIWKQDRCTMIQRQNLEMNPTETLEITFRKILIEYKKDETKM